MSVRGSDKQRSAAWRWWVLPVVLVLVWLAVAGYAGPFAGKLAGVETNNGAAFLPASAESTQVAQLQKHFRSRSVTPAVVVYLDPGGLDGADHAGLRADRAYLAGLDGVAGRVTGPVFSTDGEAAELVVPLTAAGSDALQNIVSGIRGHLTAGVPPGAVVSVTGPAGFAADLVGAFAGIDGVLLLVAVAVVLLILIIVYRSPILPLVVLLSALFALALASGVVYALADHAVLTLNGQSQGILFILVVGAATDYALLLTARFREELRERDSRFAAMRYALARAAPAIGASGATVIAALLCLLASDLNSTSSLGPVGAIGIAAALASALTFLPAVLVLLGRAAFWPARPRHGSARPEHAGLWGGLAGRIGAHPRWLWVGATVPLIVLAAFLPTFRAGGTSQRAVFLNPAPAVAGQQILEDHFPGATGSPAVIIGPAGEAREMARTARGVPGIVSAAPIAPDGHPARAGQPPATASGLAQVQATLAGAPDSDVALAAVRRLRTAEHRAVPGAEVGGRSATTLDTQTTAEHDRLVVIPLILAVILLLLGLLLRAVVAPLLLLASVVLSFAATLGASALVFNHLLGFPGADPSVPLYGFVFLVALGIDYNIFLMTRVREETTRVGTRNGVRRGLAVTGGVITSAGVVLAATFSALSVIPLLFLAQIAFIVAFGVLLDTLLVRTVLVPALAYDLGRRIWWPARLSSKEVDEQANRGTPEMRR
jgi:RND superfamily putative drug exporter